MSLKLVYYYSNSCSWLKIQRIQWCINWKAQIYSHHSLIVEVGTIHNLLRILPEIIVGIYNFLFKKICTWCHYIIRIILLKGCLKYLSISWISLYNIYPYCSYDFCKVLTYICAYSYFHSWLIFYCIGCIIIFNLWTSKIFQAFVAIVVFSLILINDLHHFNCRSYYWVMDINWPEERLEFHQYPSHASGCPNNDSNCGSLAILWKPVN